MKTNDSNNNKWLDDRTEAYLDGELSIEEHNQFERLLQQDNDWQQEVSWAVTIRDELRAVPTPEPSPDLRKAILNEVRKDAWSNFRSRLFSGFGGEFLRDTLFRGAFLQWRPVLATLTLLVVASTFVFVINRPGTPTPDPEMISQAEVEQALAEAKWALGYVSKTGRLTGTSMQDALGPLLKEQTKE
ncbi:MAG: anti-sigma factor [Rhodothermales bacterium]